MGKQQIFISAIFYILSLSNVLGDIQYENIFCLFCPPTRRMIDTSKPSIHTSYGNWVLKGTFNNKGINRTAEFSYQYSSTNSRKFTAGLDVGAKFLFFEVKASIGGELQWSKTDTLTGQQSVPANKVGYAYIRDRISTAIFRHKVQIQEKISGKWKNKGPLKVTTSKVITTIPEIKIDIKDN